MYAQSNLSLRLTCTSLLRTVYLVSRYQIHTIPTSIIRTLWFGPLVSLLMRFDCTWLTAVDFWKFSDNLQEIVIFPNPRYGDSLNKLFISCLFGAALTLIRFCSCTASYFLFTLAQNILYCDRVRMRLMPN